MRWITSLAVVALLAAAAAPATAEPSGVTCRDGAANECLRVTAPLDPSGAVAGDVELYVERLGAVARRGTAVLLVPGGPGQAGTPFLRDTAQEFGAAIDTRDLLVYDPRGTGLSSGHRCPELPESEAALGAAVTGCERGLGPAAALYTTNEQVSDIEQIRAALGVGKLVLYGVSYGTRVATAYAARHPDRVEALVLDSPVDPGGFDLFRGQALAALPRVVREGCFATCAVASDDPGRDLVRLARGLAARPLAGWVVTPGGARTRARMDAARLVQLALTVDSNPTVDAELPSTLRAALNGDPQPILRLAARVLDAPTGGAGAVASSTGAYLAAVCAETALPWQPSASLAARRASLATAVARVSPASIGGFPREVLAASPYVQTCQHWSSPTTLPQIAPLMIPALVLSGSVDARTPVETARQAAERVHARLIEVPGAHHHVLASDVTGCARRAVRAFLAGDAPSRCTRRSPRYKTFPVIPARPARPAAPTATLRAVAATLDDLARQIWLAPSSGDGDFRVRIGGLRAGTAALASRRTSLRSFEVVAGVRVSGVLDARHATSRLRVTGPAAARGAVDVSRAGRLIGMLAGSHVRGQTRAYGHNPLPVVR